MRLRSHDLIVVASPMWDKGWREPRITTFYLSPCTVGGKNDWRIRVGDYRILYEIAAAIRIVRIYRIRHRRDVYE